MLTYAGLVHLERSLREAQVLSVYIDGTSRSKEDRRQWRVELDHVLADLRTSVADASREERRRFDLSVSLLEQRLVPYRGALGSPGWAAFITADRIVYAEDLPVPMPTRVVWSTGISAAAYVRALKQHRPVLVAIVDARKAMVYRYQGGDLEHLETRHAHAVVLPPAHMGNQPRAGFHQGVHGTTGHDAAQRQLAQGTDRMLGDVAERLDTLADPAGWIVVGGNSQVVARVLRMLPDRTRGRTCRASSLDVHASEAEIADAARRYASSMRNAQDLERLDWLVERAGALGCAVLGPTNTQVALERGQVAELYLTHRYIEAHPLDAEVAVRAAFDHGASVEEVSGEPAVQLDGDGGVGARLRFPLVAHGESVPAEANLAASASSGSGFPVQ
jgi:hypothetical protein